MTIGFIGTGNNGYGNLQLFLDDAPVKVVAVCDPYNDYRQLLARKDIDAVYSATPDHWVCLNYKK